MIDHIPPEPAVSPAHDQNALPAPSESIRSGASWNRVLQGKPSETPIDTKNQFWTILAVVLTFAASMYVVWTFFASAQVKRSEGTEQGLSTKP